MNNPIVRTRPSANALFCNVIVVKIPLTLLGEFLLEANFRMFYFSEAKGNSLFVSVNLSNYIEQWPTPLCMCHVIFVKLIIVLHLISFINNTRVVSYFSWKNHMMVAYLFSRKFCSEQNFFLKMGKFRNKGKNHFPFFC